MTKLDDAFPRSLRSFARKVRNPYKVAFYMAAAEISGLRRENAKLKRQLKRTK